MRKQIKKYFNILFQDNTGKYVVGQPPNVPVYLIVCSWLLHVIARQGAFADLCYFIFQASIFLWAYLEIRFGEAMIRRIMGAVIMTVLLIVIVN